MNVLEVCFYKINKHVWLLLTSNPHADYLNIILKLTKSTITIERKVYWTSTYIAVNNGHPAGGSGDQQSTATPPVSGTDSKPQQPKPRSTKPPPSRRSEPKSKETLVNGTTA